MFGHDKHDDDKNKDEDVVQPVSTKPVNEDFLGIDKSGDTADDSSTTPVVDDVDGNDNEEESVPVSTSSPVPSADPSNDDLLDIKRQALQELSPLVDHLDQSPEEKFKTTMMMIQASDDKSLVPTAYQAAQKISDDKVRAQALLDIINEINYFTQKKS